MKQVKTQESSYQLRMRTGTIRLFVWNAAWVAATALMAFGPKLLWNKASVLTLLAVGLDVAVGIGMVLATKRYILELDELQQRVHLNALGIAVGAGLVGGIPYQVMSSYQVIPMKADIGHLILLMGLTFMVSFLYGTWRYR